MARAANLRAGRFRASPVVSAQAGVWVAGVLVATACDAAHFSLAEDLLASLRAVAGRGFEIGFIQMGDSPAPASLTGLADHVRVAECGGAPLRADEGFRVARFAIKPRLPEFFPGFDTYVWLDGDTWVQNAAGIANLVDGARHADICAHPQIDTDYWTCRYPDAYTIKVYDRLFGQAVRDQYATFPMVNSGVFAASARSPLWPRWTALLEAIRARLEGEEQPFFSDQIPLHYLIFTQAISLQPLRAVDNWLVAHATPGLNPQTGRLTRPSAPHEELNIIHLIGPSKTQQFRFGAVQTALRYREVRRHLRLG